jgi:hypothetical protein
LLQDFQSGEIMRDFLVLRVWMGWW